MTLLEVLASILLLGILLAVILPSIVGLLGLSGKSTVQLGSAVTAQRTIEKIKGAWQRPDCYANNIVPELNITGVTLTVQNLGKRADSPVAIGNPSDALSCAVAGTVSNVPPLRRVTVSTGNGPQDTTLTLDIRRPRDTQ